MRQDLLRSLAGHGIALRRQELQRELKELDRFERSLSSRSQTTTKAKKRNKKKSMWTPERRAALSKKMKALAAERKVQAPRKK